MQARPSASSSRAKADAALLRTSRLVRPGRSPASPVANRASTSSSAQGASSNRSKSVGRDVRKHMDRRIAASKDGQMTMSKASPGQDLSARVRNPSQPSSKTPVKRLPAEEQERQNKTLLEQHMKSLTTLRSQIADGDAGSADQVGSAKKFAAMSATFSTASVDAGPTQSGGSADPVMCVALGEGLQRAVVGVPSYATVQLRTTEGAACGAGSKLLVKCNMRGPAKATTMLRDNKDGTYFVSYICNVSGVYSLDIRVGTEHIAGSSFTVQCAGGEACPTNCTMEGLGLAGTNTDDAGAFTVVTRDEYGFLRDQGGESSAFYLALTNEAKWYKGTFPSMVDIRGKAHELEFKPKDNGDGTYTIEYYGRKAGSYYLTVLLSGTHLRGSPMNVVIQPGRLHLPHCLFAGEGTQACVAGIEQSFTICPRDEHGNDISAIAHNAIRCEFAPKGQTQTMEADWSVGPVTNPPDGRHRVAYVLKTATQYSLHLTCKEEVAQGAGPINRWDFDVLCVPGPCFGPTCTSTGSALKEVVAAPSIAEFTVQSKDQYHNERTVGGDQLAVRVESVHGNVVDLSPVVTDLATTPQGAGDKHDGKYTVQYSRKRAGMYKLSVLHKEQPVMGCPFNIRVLPGPLCSRNCVITENAIQGGTVGQPSLYRIEARDECGNTRQTGKDIVSVELVPMLEPAGHNPSVPPPPAKTVQADIVDNNDGTYDAKFTIQFAGPYVVNVTAKPAGGTEFGHVDNSPYQSVVWLPGQLSPDHCTVEGDGILGACVKDQASFTIYARDKFGNLVVNCAQDFQVALTGPQRLKPKIVNNMDGTFACSYSSTITGAYYTSIMTGGKHIRGSQFNTSIVTGYFNADEARSMQAQMGVRVDEKAARNGFAGGQRATRISGSQSRR